MAAPQYAEPERPLLRETGMAELAPRIYRPHVAVLGRRARRQPQLAVRHAAQEVLIPPRTTRPSDLGSAPCHDVGVPLDHNLHDTVNLGPWSCAQRMDDGADDYGSTDVESGQGGLSRLSNFNLTLNKLS
jgi:hypothetical protein